MKTITIIFAVLLFPLVGFILLSNENNDKTVSLKVVSTVPDEISQYEMIEIIFQVNAEFNDPYSSSDIKMDGLVSGPNGDKLVPAFFENRADNGKSIWKIRFTPRFTGEYKITAELISANGSDTSSEIQFNSVPSDKEGYLKLPENGSHYYLEFDSGKKFRGVGINYAWEDQPWDSETPLYFTEFFKTLNNSGANIVRKWMNPWSLPLIWTQPDNEDLYSAEEKFKFNRSGIERTDLMFKEALKNGIYVILVLDYHGAIQTEPDYWGGNNYWEDHPDNIMNGGSAETPSDFFTDDSAKLNYKDRLRFIIARWGAFTNLATIELWNEVDNALENEGIPESSIVEWHNEMGAYLKDINPFPHLVSTSVSHRHIPDLFAAEGIDYSHIHIYGNTDGMAEVMDSVRVLYDKPVVIGEIGYDWRRPEVNQIEEFNDDLHNSYWNALIEPTPVYPMPWWWEFFYEETSNQVVSTIAEFNRELLKSEWNDFERMDQPMQQGIKLDMLYGGDTYTGLLSINSESEYIQIKTNHDPGSKLEVLVFDTRLGEFFSRTEKSVNNDRSIVLPGRLLNGKQQVALIIKSI